MERGYYFFSFLKSDAIVKTKKLKQETKRDKEIAFLLVYIVKESDTCEKRHLSLVENV